MAQGWLYVKAREPRRTIHVTARMKSADGWQDVAIRNVSAHGMKILVALPPRRGTFIEIRRASQVIVARTVWVENTECGLRTQDVVDIPALLDPNAACAEAVATEARNDRRRAPRADDITARSQRYAALFQFAAMTAAIVVAASYAAWMVSDIVGAPVARIIAALSGNPPATENAAIHPID